MNKTQEELVNTLVSDGEFIATVTAFVSSYQQAHPTVVVTAKRQGDQVFIGDQASGAGINLDVAHPDESIND